LPKSEEDIANQIYVTDQISKIIPGKGYLYGLNCTNGIEGALQDLLVGVGECVDSTGVKLMKVTTPIQKRVWESWEKGTNKGGRATGVNLTNATTYHTFIIADDFGNVDAGQDTDISATNLLATSGYTYFRRIRSDLTVPASVTLTGTVAVTSGNATITGTSTKFLSELMAGNSVTINGETKLLLSVTSDTVATATTNFAASASSKVITLSSSPNLTALYQNGDTFMRYTSALASSSVVTTATLLTIPTPLGIKTIPIIHWTVACVDGAVMYSYLTDVETGMEILVVYQKGGGNGTYPITVITNLLSTNTSSQIIYRSTATTSSSTLSILGYIDSRGRN